MELTWSTCTCHAALSPSSASRDVHDACRSLEVRDVRRRPRTPLAQPGDQRSHHLSPRFRHRAGPSPEQHALFTLGSIEPTLSPLQTNDLRARAQLGIQACERQRCCVHQRHRMALARHAYEYLIHAESHPTSAEPNRTTSARRLVRHPQLGPTETLREKPQEPFRVTKFFYAGFPHGLRAVALRTNQQARQPRESVTSSHHAQGDSLSGDSLDQRGQTSCSQTSCKRCVHWRVRAIRGILKISQHAGASLARLFERRLFASTHAARERIELALDRSRPGVFHERYR